MSIQAQIILSLAIILASQTIILLFVILRPKIQPKVKGGLEIGQKLPRIAFENMDGEAVEMNDTLFQETRLLFFVDMNCPHCVHVLSVLDAYAETYLKQVKLVLVKSEENLKQMATNKHRYKSMFIEETVFFDQFKVWGFPFVMQVDENGEVINKGYLSKNTLIDYLTA